MCAQVSIPAGRCEHGSGCKVACHLTDPHLVSLCDALGIASRAYGTPEPGTVFLINRLDKVDMIGDLSNLGPITRRAKKLADNLEERQTRIYGN